MTQSILSLFSSPKPVLGCIHLAPLPGAPEYGGDTQAIVDQALHEATLLEQMGLHGLMIENFNDVPFFPDSVPPETIAAMAFITREIVKVSRIPVGVNVLRNDARAAMAIAAVTGARFIRVNVHLGAMVTDQGLIQGQAHQTLRLRQALGASVHIMTDVAVKHAAPLAERPLELEVLDLVERGLSDAIIVTGDRTGGIASLERLQRVKAVTSTPVFVGSGVTPDQLGELLPLVDGFIVGSAFKQDGRAANPVSEDRVKRFMQAWRSRL